MGQEKNRKRGTKFSRTKSAFLTILGSSKSAPWHGAKKFGTYLGTYFSTTEMAVLGGFVGAEIPDPHRSNYFLVAVHKPCKSVDKTRGASRQ